MNPQTDCASQHSKLLIHRASDAPRKQVVDCGSASRRRSVAIPPSESVSGWLSVHTRLAQSSLPPLPMSPMVSGRVLRWWGANLCCQMSSDSMHSQCDVKLPMPDRACVRCIRKATGCTYRNAFPVGCAQVKYLMQTRQPLLRGAGMASIMMQTPIFLSRPCQFEPDLIVIFPNRAQVGIEFNAFCGHVNRAQSVRNDVSN